MIENYAKNILHVTQYLGHKKIDNTMLYIQLTGNSSRKG
jgi:hypothetical protein